MVDSSKGYIVAID
jgi:glycerol kinase